MYFSSKISYTAEGESGEVISITEDYLVKDESFAGVEAAIYAHCEEQGIDDFKLESVAKKKVNNLIFLDEFPYFEFKVIMISESEKTGKEKRLTDVCIVGAKDFEQAFERVKADYKKCAIPWTIEAGKITKFTAYVKTEEEEIEGDCKDEKEEEEEGYVGNSWPGVLFPDNATGVSGPKDYGLVGVPGPIGESEESIRGNRKSSVTGHALTEEIVMEPTERTLAVGRSDEGDIFESFKSLPGVLSPLPDNSKDGPKGYVGPDDFGADGTQAPNGPNGYFDEDESTANYGHRFPAHGHPIIPSESSKEIEVSVDNNTIHTSVTKEQEE